MRMRTDIGMGAVTVIEMGMRTGMGMGTDTEMRTEVGKGAGMGLYKHRSCGTWGETQGKEK